MPERSIGSCYLLILLPSTFNSDLPPDAHVRLLQNLVSRVGGVSGLIGVQDRVHFERHLTAETIIINSFFTHVSWDFLSKGKRVYKEVKDKASETFGL